MCGSTRARGFEVALVEEVLAHRFRLFLEARAQLGVGRQRLAGAQRQVAHDLVVEERPVVLDDDVAHDAHRLDRQVQAHEAAAERLDLRGDLPVAERLELGVEARLDPSWPNGAPAVRPRNLSRRSRFSWMSPCRSIAASRCVGAACVGAAAAARARRRRRHKRGRRWRRPRGKPSREYLNSRAGSANAARRARTSASPAGCRRRA